MYTRQQTSPFILTMHGAPNSIVYILFVFQRNMEVNRAKQEGAIGADYIASTNNVLLICSYDFQVSLKDKLA